MASRHDKYLKKQAKRGRSIVQGPQKKEEQKKRNERMNDAFFMGMFLGGSWLWHHNNK